MPGALDDPSPYSSLASVPAAQEGPEGVSRKDTLISDELLRQPSFINQPQRLPPTRSLSLEERDLFTASLARFSEATVYAVPTGDIHTLHASAVRMGFHARMIVNKDVNDPQALLILGKEEKAVQRLQEKVEVEQKQTGSSSLRVLAGGAVAGAVGTFAGLAFA